MKYTVGTMVCIADGAGIPKGFYPCNGKHFYFKDFPHMKEAISDSHMRLSEFLFQVPDLTEPPHIREVQEVITRRPENMHFREYIYLGDNNEICSK